MNNRINELRLQTTKQNEYIDYYKTHEIPRSNTLPTGINAKSVSFWSLSTLKRLPSSL